MALKAASLRNRFALKRRGSTVARTRLACSASVSGGDEGSPGTPAVPGGGPSAEAVAEEGSGVSLPAYVPDMTRRTILNLLLAGAVALPSTAVIGGWLYMLVPPTSGSSGGGIPARDQVGAQVFASTWLASHPPGDRTLVEGLKGDATYLVVGSEGELASFGINAVCTHLGCVVPFNAAENKFMCPCHGSQYNNQGKVVRGPAPLSLALARVQVADDKVFFLPWTEIDFRTNQEPWWS